MNAQVAIRGLSMAFNSLKVSERLTARGTDDAQPHPFVNEPVQICRDGSRDCACAAGTAASRDRWYLSSRAVDPLAMIASFYRSSYPP